ncbi:hypothetical protein F2Q68_00039177 [Brassica cretica]|uniref:KIB1-4 beta-propeller domain-containing protein n=1 Tax=Brassica cretica TaxID=69181 RepID=A0A8S9MEZ6_BRACR|nr:hypothetical protein F2Q68_00039177 [Brassica cretica]
MSRILYRSLLKRSLRIDAFRQRFSFSSASYTPPYLICGASKDSGTLVFTNLGNSEVVTSKKRVPSELLEASGTIGAAHGWVGTLKDGVLSLHDNLNPNASDSNPKQILLPPLLTLPDCQTEVVANVAMSSSSPEDDECVVAVKFSGPQLSLCRPAHDPNWTNIRVTDHSFFSSRVIFSKRDQMFTLLASGGHHTGSWDLHKHKDNPKLQKLNFQNLPAFTKIIANLIDSSYITEHLVESSAGITYLVKWYVHSTVDDDTRDVKTKGLVVFRLDQEGNAFYTNDIGDVNIFISKNEPFCLSASSHHDLEPNTVFLVDSDEFGFINLSESANTSNVSASLSFKAPYLIPPQKLNHGLYLGN